MHHERKYAHLRGAAVVELYGKLLVDRRVVPARRFQLRVLDLACEGGVLGWVSKGCL
jgi:hypothetical protein